MKLFNKRGDGGETSLLYGQRVSKADPRPEAYGTLDEANSTLGLAKALSKNQKIKEIIHGIQEVLFVLGAELASDPQNYEKLKKKITQDDVLQLEGLIDELEGQVRLPDSFIIPGGTLVAAVLDMARTIVRRGERRAVRLKENGLLSNDSLLAYLNRTADLLFILARYDETVGGEGI
ncbi:MAG: cob(I)yrinic acid a,c-diamide adenosyltransferase [Thermodesulfobacteriota bacterium]|nr:cob(I)yrinic acid a,c-diamide adenosyltransferase [Thermodesulfobacteriota bacterium]